MIEGPHNIASITSAAGPARAPSARGSTRRLTGLKIMVIDDSNTIRRSAEMLLKQADCEVILAEDGFDALQKVSIHHPDLIFADVLMPRLNGYQTCALIKRSGIYSQIPVVMLTSKDTLFDRARGFAVGANHHLTKPFTKETLLRTVEALVPLKCAAATMLHS